MTKFRTVKDVLAYFEDWKTTPKSLSLEGHRSEKYLLYHWRRYAFLLREIEMSEGTIRDEFQADSLKVLDIGPSFQTEMIRKALPRACVDTLGFEDSRFAARPGECHYNFDFNDAQDEACWPRIGPYHLIVMAEVIEHLHASPRRVMACFTSWLEKGGRAVIQTPNACALHKRIRMLLGSNPYEMVRDTLDTRDDPRHFHEYTLAELVAVGKDAGLTVTRTSMENYFGNSLLHRAYNSLSSLLPRGLRTGITITFEK